MESSWPPKPTVLHAGQIGLGQLDALHHFEIRRIQNDHVVAELVEVFAVGRDFEAAAATAAAARGILVVRRNVDGRAIFCCARSITVYLGLPISKRSDLLVDLGGDGVEHLALGIGRAAVEAIALGRACSSTKWLITLRVATSMTSMPL